MLGPHQARICKDSSFLLYTAITDLLFISLSYRDHSLLNTTGTVILTLLFWPLNSAGSHFGDLLTAATAASLRSGLDPKAA